MKKMIPLMLMAFLLSMSQISFAQNKTTKDINVEKNDDDIKVTVTEEKNGKTYTKVMTGEEAERYLEENNDVNVYIDGDEIEEIIRMEMAEGMHGHGYNVWVEDMEVDMAEMEEELERLKEELDQLSKEEIAERLDEITALKEEMHKMKIIELSEGGHNVMVYGDGNDEDVKVDVEVSEEDGVVTIVRTIGDTKEVEEIKVNSDSKSSYVFITKNEGKNNEKSIEISDDAKGDMFEAKVFPTPNNGNFTVEVELLDEAPAYVKVIDASGKEVYSQKIQGEQKHQLDVKLKKPAAGMYVVTIEQEGKKMKIKTVIE